MTDPELMAPRMPGGAAGLTADDRSHLDTLGICHWVLAGLNGLGCLGMGAYGIFVYVFLSRMPEEVTRDLPNGEEFRGLVMGMMVAVLGLAVVYQLVVTVLHWLCGNYLRRRRHRTFCFVVAGVSLINIPIGTVLGVFTIIVLSRPQVSHAFESEAQKAVG